MRVTVLILSLLLGALMFVQTVLVYGLGSAANDEGSSGSGAIGVFMCLLWLVAAAFVIPLPMVSVVAFAIAALLGFAVSGDFPDLAIWGGASLVLGVLSLLGWRGKRKGQREQAAERTRQMDRDNRMEAMMQQGFRPQMAASVGVMRCTQCGTDNPSSTRFCGNCGAQLVA